jgi:hypothetical protein
VSWNFLLACAGQFTGDARDENFVCSDRNGNGIRSGVSTDWEAGVGVHGGAAPDDRERHHARARREAPQALAFDAKDNLCIAAMENQRVRTVERSSLCDVRSELGCSRGSGLGPGSRKSVTCAVDVGALSG